MTRFLRVRVLGHDVRTAVRPGTAPEKLGSHRLSVLAEAPGTYVFDK